MEWLCLIGSTILCIVTVARLILIPCKNSCVWKLGSTNGIKRQGLITMKWSLLSLHTWLFVIPFLPPTMLVKMNTMALMDLSMVSVLAIPMVTGTTGTALIGA